MKQNETKDQNELESINGEMFQSFDPDDASWITGGKVVYTASGTVDSNGKFDGTVDIQVGG
jgi:hypothetical protein